MDKNKFREMPKFDNIKEIIYNSVKLYPNNIAFTIKTKMGKEAEYKEITYSNLIEDINGLGTSFFEMGLTNSRIAIIGKNSYEWSISHLANQLGGIVSIPLDKELQVDELEESIIRSEADAIVFDEKHLEQIEEIKNNAKTNLKHYICMTKKDSYIYIYDLIKEGKELIESGKNEYINFQIDPNKMSILLFTSGTTSKSKAVMLSQYGIASNVYDMQIVESFYSTDVNIAFLPYHHIFGSTGMVVVLASRRKNSISGWLKIYKAKFNRV
ncbi:long-chain-fatty-acid--CoA ligase [compost metagenome]